MRTKNGSIGNAPGNFRRTSSAEPSSSVMTAARPVISQTSLALNMCMSVAFPVPSAAAASCRSGDWTLETYSGSALREFADQIEDRQIHRDDDPANDDAEECDHHRLHQRQQSCHRGIDFLFVKVSNF